MVMGLRMREGGRKGKCGDKGKVYLYMKCLKFAVYFSYLFRKKDRQKDRQTDN